MNECSKSSESKFHFQIWFSGIVRIGQGLILSRLLFILMPMIWNCLVSHIRIELFNA